MADTYLGYTTRQGDTFDIIALVFYSDEFQASRIMQANPEQIGTVVFPDGVKLKIPLIEQTDVSILPPWKR